MATQVEVSIDNVRLVFNGNTATKNLPDGPHSLTWTVIGNPGTSYTIRITRPPGITCAGGATLDNDGIDHGGCRFVI
jgi:hypothetical protein